MRFFPSSINVAGRECWVIGHDREAVEKAGRLCDAGAMVTVVSDAITPEALEKFQALNLRLLQRSFALADIQDQFFIVLSAKDNPKLCEDVYRVCRQKRVLLCAIDQPKFCDVINVSLYKKGHLAIMISTEGAAPAVSRRIRLGLAESLKDVPMDQFLDKLAELRVELEKLEKDPDERRKKLLAAVEGFDFRAEVQLPK